jgi:polar amino acid transport system substrate-binding protein
MKSASTIRRSLTFCAVVVVAGAAAACGSSSASSSLMETVTSSKEISIGTSNDAPWSSVNSTGEAEGIVPDILREFLKRAGIEATLKPTAMPFDSLIPSITSNRIDMIGDAIFATEPREKEVSFTRTIFYNADGLVVRKGNPDGIKAVSDLCGKVGATYKGTVWVDTLEQASSRCPQGQAITVKVYGSAAEVMQDIASERVDGGLIDASLAAYALHQNSDLGVELATGYTSPDREGSDNALAVSKTDSSFVEAFNPVYTEMLKDGTVEKIFDKWGLAPASQFLPTS